MRFFHRWSKEMGNFKSLWGMWELTVWNFKILDQIPRALYEEASAVKGNKWANTHTHHYKRQYASVTRLTCGLGMSCVCSPPLACWKIKVVEQCSSVLNNVWAGSSRGIRDREGGKRSLLLPSFISSPDNTGWKMIGHARKNTAHSLNSITAHMCITVYLAKITVQCQSELRRVSPKWWWHVSRKTTHFPPVLATVCYVPVSQIKRNGLIIMWTEYYQWVLRTNTNYWANINHI